MHLRTTLTTGGKTFKKKKNKNKGNFFKCVATYPQRRKRPVLSDSKLPTPATSPNDNSHITSDAGYQVTDYPGAVGYLPPHLRPCKTRNDSHEMNRFRSLMLDYETKTANRKRFPDDAQLASSSGRQGRGDGP